MALTHAGWDEQKLTRTIGRGVLALLVIAWGTYSVLNLAPDAGWRAWTLAVGSIVLLVIPALGAWIRRREAGAIAVGMGVFAASFFAGWAPQVLLAFPLAAAGVLLLWSPDRAHADRPAPAPKPERAPEPAPAAERPPETDPISLSSEDDEIRADGDEDAES